MVHAQGSDFRLGGSGCLTAIALSHLGSPVLLSGNLGRDVFADFVMRTLQSAGMDTRLVRQHEGQSSGFFVNVATPGGQRTMFGSRGANDLSLPEKDIVSLFSTSRHLHISGYTLRADAQFEVVKRIFEGAKAAGLTTSLDPGVCISQEAKERIFTLLKGLDYFLPNVNELKNLTGDVPLAEQLSAILTYGCKAVALKMGVDGSRFFDGQQDISQAVSKEIQAGDTTGAGDCFNAGFLHSVFKGESKETALLAGNQAAARMLTSPHGILDWKKHR
jgi:sugar/nucleoside kinase (ribokinase family)